jgi:hypothetical protein
MQGLGFLLDGLGHQLAALRPALPALPAAPVSMDQQSLTHTRETIPPGNCQRGISFINPFMTIWLGRKQKGSTATMNASRPVESRGGREWRMRATVVCTLYVNLRARAKLRLTGLDKTLLSYIIFAGE